MFQKRTVRRAAVVIGACVAGGVALVSPASAVAAPAHAPAAVSSGPAQTLGIPGCTTRAEGSGRDAGAVGSCRDDHYGDLFRVVATCRYWTLMTGTKTKVVTSAYHGIGETARVKCNTGSPKTDVIRTSAVISSG